MSTIAACNAQQYPTAYNGIGRLYDLYWRNVSTKLMPALDSLVLEFLPRGASVLDLCCGTGTIAAAMCRRGLRVTGLDGSDDMVRFARRNAPRAQFVVGDARRFAFNKQFDAVISTGDSMNHMLTAGDLTASFRSVHAALAVDGRFVFDMNMAEAFKTQWRKSSTDVAPDHLLYVRGKYEGDRKLGTTDVTVFSMQHSWARLDLRVFQRCYGRHEIAALLLQAGFSEITVHPAKSLGIRGRLAVGRMFFAARKRAQS